MAFQHSSRHDIYRRWPERHTRLFFGQPLWRENLCSLQGGVRAEFCVDDAQDLLGRGVEGEQGEDGVNEGAHAAATWLGGWALAVSLGEVSSSNAAPVSSAILRTFDNVPDASFTPDAAIFHQFPGQLPNGGGTWPNPLDRLLEQRMHLPPGA